MNPIILTIGFFDGIHLGHKKLIDTTIRESGKSANTESLLVTFDKTPCKQSGLITTLPEKLGFLRAFNLDNIKVIPFTPQLKNLSPAQFFNKILLSDYAIKKIVIGYDFKFGKNRTGDSSVLQKLCHKHNIEIIKIHPVKYCHKIVSSSYIRSLISEGNFESANKLLIYPFTISGKVIKGRGIAKKYKLVPTANLSVDTTKLLPAGVFFTKIIINTAVHNGIVNIGRSPTLIRGNSPLTAEVHIFNFGRNIVNKQIKLILLKKIRSEKKFGSIESLRAQISKDIAAAKQIAHYQVKN